MRNQKLFALLLIATTATASVEVGPGAPAGVTSVAAGIGLSSSTVAGTATVSLTSPVTVPHGGTGKTSFTTGSIPYASASTMLSEDNANLSWNPATLGLGIGTTAAVNGRLEVDDSLNTSAIYAVHTAGAGPTNPATGVYGENDEDGAPGAAIYGYSAVTAASNSSAVFADVGNSSNNNISLLNSSNANVQLNFRIPSSGTPSTTSWLFPVGNPTANTFLKNNGSGTLTWSSAPPMAIGGAITSGTAGSALFVDGSGQLAQDNANLFWDATNKREGVGTATPAAPMDVNGSFVGAASSHITEMLTSFGDVDRFVMRAANGTSGAPTAVTAALNLGSIGFRGYNGAAFSGVSAASFNAVPAETWTTTANGTSLNFQTTPTGSTTAAERLRITSQGAVGIGSASPVGALEVKTAYTTTAATGGAVLVDSVVTAHANNDQLAGIYSNPTFASGGHSGTLGSAAYLAGNSALALTLFSDGNSGTIQENYSGSTETMRIGSNGWILADGAGGGSASNPVYGYLADGHSGGWMPTPSQLAWSTASTERMRLTNTGLGIGKTPASALDVVGTAVADNFLSNGKFDFGGTAYLAVSGIDSGAGPAAFGYPSSTSLGQLSTFSIIRRNNGAAYPQYLDFALGRYMADGANARTQVDLRLNDTTTGFGTPVTVMSLLANGDVGIGSTAPAATLDVAGTFKLGATGGVTTAAGSCTTSSGTPSTAPSNFTCTTVPASSSVWVGCSGAAAFSTAAADALYCRPTGTADTIACNTTVANVTAMTLTCSWVQP